MPQLFLRRALLYLPLPTGQPSQTILVDPVDGMYKVVFTFYAVDNAGIELTCRDSSVQMLIDTDRDGIPEIYDIDDDNDGIPDVIEVCLVGATTFSCAPVELTLHLIVMGME